MSDDRKDLPPSNSPNFLEKVREALSVYLGSRGDGLDRGITVRDLSDAKIITLNPNYRPGSKNNPVKGPGPSVTDIIGDTEVDLTPPPTPTGFAASAAIINIVVLTNAPTYTQGHGHQKCRLYGSTLASPVFANAVLLTEFPGNIGSYATNPATTWHLWITWVSNDGVESLSPAGGTNGLVVTTGQNVATLLTALAGQIAASQLDATLTARVNLIDGATGLTGSVNQRLDAQNTTLSAQIASVAVGTGDGFDSAQIWYFDSTVESWTGSPSNPTVTGGYLKPTNGTGTYLISPSSLAVASATYSQVKMRIRKVGTPTWAGKLWWADVSQDLVTAGRSYTISAPTFDGSGIAVVTVTPGWTGNIDRFRVDLVAVQDASNYIEIDWIGVGRSAPGASVASVQTESSARVTADNFLYAQYTVKLDTAGLISGFGLASTTSGSAPTSIFGVRANAFYIAPPATSSSTAPSSNLFNGYTWYDTTTSTTKFYRSSDATWQTSPTSIPFAVQTTPTTINGVAVPAGVYMDAAFISNGTITNAKIGNAAIDDAKISSLSVAKLLAGSIAVGEYVQSTGFVSGSAGWKINGDGTAEFAATMIRGQLTASQIDSRGLTIKDGAGTVIFSSGTPLGSANMATGQGGNLVPNSAMDSGIANWAVTWVQGGGTAYTAPALDLAGDTWRPGGGHSVGAFRNGTTGAASGYFDVSYMPLINLIEGKRYEASAYVASHRCVCEFNIELYSDVNGASYVTEVGWARVTTTNNGGNNLNDWERVGGFFTVPTNVRCCRVRVRSYAATGADPYTWATKLFLAQAGTNQTELSPWSDGSRVGAFSELNQITSGNVSTYIANVAIGTAQIANAAITSAKIGTAEVQTANINDAAITSAKIADASITNAKIGTAAIQTANIVDANITTLKINGQAVNNIVAATNASAWNSYIAPETTFTTVTSASITISEANQALFVDMGCLLSFKSGAFSGGGISCDVALRYAKDGGSMVTCGTLRTKAASPLVADTKYSYPFRYVMPNPASGTYVFYLQIYKGSGAGDYIDIAANDGSVTAMGVKR